jgi:hypothetical protein
MCSDRVQLCALILRLASTVDLGLSGPTLLAAPIPVRSSLDARTGSSRAWPGSPRPRSAAGGDRRELICLAAAQVLLRYHDERHWLWAAPPG